LRVAQVLAHQHPEHQASKPVTHAAASRHIAIEAAGAQDHRVRLPLQARGDLKDVIRMMLAVRIGRNHAAIGMMSEHVTDAGAQRGAFSKIFFVPQNGRVALLEDGGKCGSAAVVDDDYR